MDGDVGRSYAQIYGSVSKREPHAFVESAVKRSGGRVLASSGPNCAPLFLGVDSPKGQPLGICAYVFRANGRRIRNRPQDEHRFQLRYGDVNDAAWKAQAHPVGFDPLRVDTTLVLGVHEDAELLIAVDPIAYNPLPLGISVFFKDDQVNAAQEKGWHVWERDNVAGILRSDTRTPLGLETMVAFRPERFLDYVEFERRAQELGLDPVLRFRAAEAAGERVDGADGVHALEKQFGLDSQEILDIINERPRLGMAVRGGVAERHLHKLLASDPSMSEIELGQAEGPPDFIVRVTGRTEPVTIECKNASPRLYAGGIPKVETQKTRASKGDPRSRLYEPSQFDVLGACMFGPSGKWEFRFKRSKFLERDQKYGDRLKPIQRIDDSWAPSLTAALTRQ